MTTVGPLPNSYWLLSGTLLAGEYPGAYDEDAARAKLELILAAGIRSFIDLTHEADGLAPYDRLLASMARERHIEHRYQRFAITNLAVPTREEMGRILAAIRGEIGAGRPVYLHCWGGIGRTGTVAGCWLVEEGSSGDDAIERISQLRRGTPNRHARSPETAEQRTFVCEWSRPPC